LDVSREVLVSNLDRDTECLQGFTWFIEETIERAKRRGRILKHLLCDVKERRYWNLKEAALDCTVWRNCFAGGYGPVARETM
jgi:hypothetical protein